jgi:hypothetical protein
MAVTGTDWTDAENDAVVADYFAMLTDELAGRPYSKTEHRRRLQTLIGRSEGSLEFKHQNVSAVLMALGEVWINGYKPKANFQDSLVDAVARWLHRNHAWTTRPPKWSASAASGLAEEAMLWIGPPPTRSNAPPPPELERLTAIANRFDVADRDARNRALGKAGEERVLLHERSVLTSAGRSDLARKIRWVAQEDGDGAGYDIASFEADGRPRLIEVKTTNGWERTPFHISRNELAVADANRSTWCLLRLWNFDRGAKAFEIRPPLDAHLSLTPTSFLATCN